MPSVGKILWMMTVLVIWVEVNGCLEQEKAGLLQLKQHLNDQIHLRPKWLASWNEGITSDCCDDWVGVTCGPNHRVVSLFVLLFGDYDENSSFEVHFNASILIPFAELRELNLINAYIKKWDEYEGAPKLSSRLKSLELLNLQGNRFNVNVLSQFHGYSSLKYLFLDDNQLKGLVQLHDIEAIGQNLEELSLVHNQITGFINHNGSSKLSSSIKVLDLSENKLDNNIISQLSGFQSLHTLHLGFNQLKGGNIHIPLNASYYGGLVSLRELDLSYNQLREIPIWLRNITRLETLDLSDNQLVGEIPIWLGNMTRLETLDLSSNELIGNIGSSPLHHILSLTELRVESNSLQIPYSFQSFANHTRLKSFFGDSNKVVHDHLQTSIPVRLQLQELGLSDCSLFAYPPFLTYQRDLMYVDLSDNSIQEFPTWLFENNLRLDTIILNNNLLTGSLQLPSLDPANANVSVIEVGNNKIQGHIPANINVVFPKLVGLDLSNNEFKGNVPLGIGDLHYLKTLSLSNNHFIWKDKSLAQNLTIS